MRAGRKRNDIQLNQDLEFLAKTMGDSPQLNCEDYHELLMAHVQDREKEKAYTISLHQVWKDMKRIRTGYARGIGVNIQHEIENANTRLEELIELTSMELYNRLEDRILITKKTKELKYDEVKAAQLSPAQLEVLKTIDLEVKVEEVLEKTIPGGSDINELILTLDKLIKSKRELFGLDAPKKVDKRIQKMHNLDSMSVEGLVQMFESLKLPTAPLKKYIAQTFKADEAKQITQEKKNDNPDV
jgi:hypothetical protein